MTAYAGKSIDELRLEDYVKVGKCPPGTGGVALGAAQNTGFNTGGKIFKVIKLLLLLLLFSIHD